MTEPNDKDRALVSVIVPVYNIADYVEKCVQSIVSQTYTNLEILLIDDGSTDGSSNVCDELSLIDPRIRVIHKDNGGVASARNRGIQEAKGDYLSFIDGDDYIDADMIESLVELSITEKADIAYCRYRYITESSNKDIISDEKTIITVCSGIEAVRYCLLHKPGFDLYAWDGLYARSVICEFVKDILYEDQVFTVEAMLKSTNVVSTSSKKYNYCIRENSLTTGSSMQQKVDDWGKVIDILYDQLKELDKETIEAFNNRCLRNYIDLLSISVLRFDGEDFSFICDKAKFYARKVYCNNIVLRSLVAILLSIKIKLLYRIVFKCSNYILARLK